VCSPDRAGSHLDANPLMLLYLVLDLSLLRGDSRESNLGKLFATVTRTLLSSPPDDLTFGYTIYDSHVGGYMVSYQLNMVAQGCGIPKNVATTSACDLTRDDLINFLTLVKLATDKHVVEELNLRTSRNSRSSDIPAVETCKVLHTVLKTTCVHKLQKSLAGASDDLSHSSSQQEAQYAGSKYGYLLIMTPSLGSDDVLHGYVGKETLEGCKGNVEEAFLKHLPMSLWKALDSHRLSCAWVSGNGAGEVDLLRKIEGSVRTVFPRFAMTSLDVVGAKGMERGAFVEQTGFVVPAAGDADGGEEASSKQAAAAVNSRDVNVDLNGVWAETAPHSSLELLQVSMGRMMPRAAQMTPLGRKSRKNRNSNGNASGKGAAIVSVVGVQGKSTKRSGVRALGASKKTAGVAMQSKRGQKAIRRARMPEGGNAVAKQTRRLEEDETPTSTVDGNQAAQDQNIDGNVLSSAKDAKSARNARNAHRAKGTTTGKASKNHDHIDDGNVKNVDNDGTGGRDDIGETNKLVTDGDLVPYVEDLTPCTVAEASARFVFAVARIQTQVLDKTSKASSSEALRAASEAVALLTSTVQRAMAEVAKRATDGGEAFDASSCRTAFVEAACMPVKELQQMHRTMPFEQLQTLAWTSAVQLLLRLCIATTSCPVITRGKRAPSTVSMSPEGFEAVEDIMHIIVATMSPIPSQGHALFLKVIRPCFVGKMKDDIQNLEKSIWDEEEMVVDEDGALADVRLAAESLEESGETPDESMNSDDAGGKVPSKTKNTNNTTNNNSEAKGVSKSRRNANSNGKHAQAVAVSKKVKAIKKANAKATSTQTAGESAGTHPMPSMSADGSGIHGGGNYAGTAVSGRRGELSNNLLSRRFNNSAQYTKMVRAIPSKSKMVGNAKPAGVAAKAKATKNGSQAKSGQTSAATMPSGPPGPSRSHRQIPDTPLGKLPGQCAEGVQEGAHATKNTTAGASHGATQWHGAHGMTTPDTAMKKAEDVIPNTSPREHPPANENQMKRIGSIRQPMFDDATADAIFKASSNDGAAKNTWLSGAIVKRRKPAPSGATRMGDMQNVDSITLARQDTDTDLHREIMSPLKPSARRPPAQAEEVDATPPAAAAGRACGDENENAVGNEDNADANTSVHTAEQEEYDDIEVVLSPGPFVPDVNDGDKDEDGEGSDEAGGHGNADGSRDSDDGGLAGRDDRGHDQDDADTGAGAGAGDQMEAGEPSATFDAEMSDDVDSMAAKNDVDMSECSSSHLHGGNDNEGVTSPGDETGNAQKKSPFDTPVKNRDVEDAEGGANVAPPTGERTASPNAAATATATAKPRRRRGGRLARMHGVNAANVAPNDPEATPLNVKSSHQRSRTPTRSPITIEDRGSPCKPSPGYGSFSSPPKQSESHGLVDYSSDTDSCMGDTPDVMIAMKPLIQASPDKYDSDEEDAAILNAAANGVLSPVDGDKPAPAQRRVRKRSLAAVSTRVPGEIARRNKAKALAAVAAIVESDGDGDGGADAGGDGATETPAGNHGVDTRQQQNQKLTAPLGQRKRTKSQSVGEIREEPTPQTATTTTKKVAGKMTKMPEQGDLVVCFIKAMSAFVRSTIVKEGDVALARRGKGWCLTVDVVPVGVDGKDANGPFTVKLDSTKEISSEDAITKDDGCWYRVDPSSPGPTIVRKALPSGATAAHKKASKAKSKANVARQESIPVLRPIVNAVPVTVSNPHKRRKLQPTNLRYEGKAMASAEKIQLQRTPQQGLIVSRFDLMGAENVSPSRGDPSLNEEAKSVIARAKALLAEGEEYGYSPAY